MGKEKGSNELRKGRREHTEGEKHRARGEPVKKEIEEEVVQRVGGWLDGIKAAYSYNERV